MRRPRERVPEVGIGSPDCVDLAGHVHLAASLLAIQVAMKPDELRSFEIKLRQRRNEVFDAYEHEEEDLRFIVEDRAAELEERAQGSAAGEVLAHLDDRSRREIERIDAALDRIAIGTYGVCTGCDAEIAPQRLEVLPEAALCLACAGELEKRGAPSEGARA